MIAALAIIAVAALAVVGVQAWIIYMVIKRAEAVAAEERRFLMNHILSDTPQQFAVLQAAARPDDTIEAVAEARSARPSTPQPLGL